MSQKKYMYSPSGCEGHGRNKTAGWKSFAVQKEQAEKEYDLK